jgi:hypothetical protein
MHHDRSDVPRQHCLINFAIINRMDLLARLANGNGRWCATVATECAESAKRPELATLDRAAEIFGEPLFPTNAEYQDILVLRDELGGPWHLLSVAAPSRSHHAPARGLGGAPLGGALPAPPARQA